MWYECWCIFPREEFYNIKPYNMDVWCITLQHIDKHIEDFTIVSIVK